MKLGILGKGKIVKTFMETVSELPIEKMVLLAREASRAEAEVFAAQYGFAAVFYDYGALLRSDIDAVYIALPNHLHFPYALAALQAGKSVIVEKPAVCTSEELRQLRETAKTHGVLLLEAMTTWHLPAFRLLREALPEIGRLSLVQLDFCQRSSRYDAFCAGKIHASFDPRQGGGSLMDLNVYNLAFAVGLLGMPEKAAYFPKLRRGVDTAGVMQLCYPEVQVTAAAAKDCGPQYAIRLLGDAGSIEIPQQASLFSRFTVRTNDGTVREVCVPQRHRMYYEFMEFDAIVRTHNVQQAEQLLMLTAAVTELLAKGRQSMGIE